MKEKKLLQPRVSLKQKTALVLLGVVLFFVLLEGGLRLGGFVLLSIQEHRNLQSIKQKGTYRILCLGESTTQNQYPQFLEQVLNLHNIGVHFSVIDKGRVGTNTSAILSQVEAYLDEYHPDAVIAMMGGNDRGIMYYQEIPESDSWLFRHCRVYRFGQIICMHIAKKIRKEGLYGLSGLDSGRKAKQEGTRIGVREAPAESIAPENSFKKVIELNPKNDKVYIELGWRYRAQGKFPQAEEAFKKAIDLNPENDKAYVELGYFYLEQGEFFQAANAFKKAIELNPKNEKPYFELGWIYRYHGKFPQAEEAFKKAIELNPKNDNAYVILGWFYRDQGKFPQAEEAFKKAIELNPKNDNAYVELGEWYRDQGKYSQAEDSFTKAIEINPKNEKAYAELGWIYRNQGKYSQTEDFFKKTVELNPKNDRFLRAISSLYEEMGRPELAKEYAEKINRLRLNCYAPVTVNNFRKLKEILDKRGIRLICMQYPMRSVEPLKKIFEKDEGIIFVDNEGVFKEALKKAGYKEYFRDMFGGDFGHCTEKGNRLLAENIANVILREVFHRQ